ncbi:MAG: sensor histidine kinase [Clostridia bacterium]|nr:sensor histidine kinase [Clostridia bacterium]
MKELSLNILDIAQNSVTAKSTLIRIDLVEDAETLKITVSDNGCGMSKEMVESVTSPFTTSRTTRKVGMGIPLFKMAAEQTGGHLTITSKSEKEFPDDHGTVTTALFYKNHIDYTPLGDIINTIVTLIQGMGEIDLIFTHKSETLNVELDTRVIRETLGGDIPLSVPDVLIWITEFIKEKYNIT